MSDQVTINLDIKKELVDAAASAATYKVTATVMSTGNISLALFCYATTKQSYSHPATTLDLELYPSALATAQTTGALYYRLPEVVKTCTTYAAAMDFINVVTSRLHDLAGDYPQVRKTFKGTTSYKITATAATEQ